MMVMRMVSLMDESLNFASYSSKVEEDQYRVGNEGMVHILSPRGKIGNDEIHHASHETGVIFGLELILVKKDKIFKPRGVAAGWEYHTVASILERWPKVLPKNWLQNILDS